MVNYKAPLAPSEFLLQIRRTFAAPRQRVFAAWAQPKELEHWMCKDVPSHEIIHHQQDIRAGGRWRMEIRDPAKNEVYWGQGMYIEVVRPERIVFTWAWFKEISGGARLDMHPESPITEVTVEFLDRGDQTELVLTHRGLGSEKLQKEHEGGWTGCFDQLEKTLK
jgi:uncharacterized protein YndB with AHSA1/START domain